MIAIIMLFRLFRYNSGKKFKKSYKGGYGAHNLINKGQKRNRINTILSENANIGLNLTFSRLRKSYFELKNQRVAEINKMILKHIQSNENLNSILDGHGVTIDSIKLLKIDREQPFKEVTVEASNKTYTEILKELETNIRNTFMAKDVTFLSDGNYSLFRTLSQLESELPTIHYLRKERDNINKKIPEIKKNDFGVFFNVEDKITWVLESKIDTLSLKSNHINICLRGDKTII